MKALPLWQPWASLVAGGAKRIETRHWQAPAHLVGQRIAIHATKRTSELWICELHPFAEYIDDPSALPLGAIVATATLARCAPMTEEGIATLAAEHPHEHAFGNYAVGRFAWVLHDVERLAEPVPFRGSQGIFDVPEQLLGPALAVPSAPAQGAPL